MAYFETHVLDNQIKALDTIGTASGSIATFDTDRAERLVKCVCEVASGSSEINVTACGSNLFDLKGWLTANGVTYTESGDEITFNTSGALFSNPYIFNSRNMNLSMFMTITPITATAVGFDVLDEDNNVIANRVPYFNNKNVCKMRLNWSSSGSVTIKAPMVNIGASALPYEPYNGTKLNIPFGETLSGDGTFDVLSGILTRSDDTTKQLDSNYILTNNGINNVYCDTGNTEVNYIMTVGKAIS